MSCKNLLKPEYPSNPFLIPFESFEVGGDVGGPGGGDGGETLISELPLLRGGGLLITIQHYICVCIFIYGEARYM